MSEERRKGFVKKSTGAVPKVKHGNGRSHFNGSSLNCNLSNNLGYDCYSRDLSSQVRSPDRNIFYINPHPTAGPHTFDEHHHAHSNSFMQPCNMPANEALSNGSTSGSTSRRDSFNAVSKCDNVKKLPNKKQVEDKLMQIREYLRVTTSLMATLKNGDDPSTESERKNFEKMIKDLNDSETKLLTLLNSSAYEDNVADDCDGIEMEENRDVDVAISDHMQRFSKLLDIVAFQEGKLNNACTNVRDGENQSDADTAGYQRNALEEKVEETSRKVQLLKEQQNALINLKQKAENQLRHAQIAQDNLRVIQQQQQQQQQQQTKACNHPKVQLERTCAEPSEEALQERFNVTIQELEDRLNSLRTEQKPNGQVDVEVLQERLDNSNQLMHLLDSRDAQLHFEHAELQGRLSELQAKKSHVDQLVDELQTLGSEDDEDIGAQVRKIMTMKQDLSKLKDMLELVKSTETSLIESQNMNGLDLDVLEMRQPSAKTDNLRQEGRANDNNATRADDQWLEKLSNKSMMAIHERQKVLEELKAKKRELEEVMLFKQKDSISYHNDVCSETSTGKPDLSTNSFEGVATAWMPINPNQHHNHSAAAYSSDEGVEDPNYSDINVQINSIPTTHLNSSNISTSSRTKHLPSELLEQTASSSFLPQSPERNRSRSRSVRERTTSNSASEAGDTKAQMQKQLEMMQNVCQSMLDLQTMQSGQQQLRNNLTPSPLYAEPRPYYSPNMPFYPPQVAAPFGDVPFNQHMFTASTLQTQSFLLNTLNQCCQMLWYQQKEIASLKNMIYTMQNGLMANHHVQDYPDVATPPTIYATTPRPPPPPTNYRAPPPSRTPKENHVSAACSLPNLNHHTNVDASVYTNQCAVRTSPSARLLVDACLNNHNHAPPLASLNHAHVSSTTSDQQPLPNNNSNSGVHVNNNHVPSQIWNGQALNNQVAPGNRANNYWDNFRSYSRQNLLSASSKSNDGLHNAALAAAAASANSAYDRSHSLSLPPLNTPPKLNTAHDSSNSSEESTPRRCRPRPRHQQHQLHLNTLHSNNKASGVPPDVLNIHHNARAGESALYAQMGGALPLLHPTRNVQQPPDLHVAAEMSDMCATHSNVSQEATKDGFVLTRNRNEWRRDDEQLDTSHKSKLFDELRENVYKEVANLISTNESRPHFLIQLFRDLQHINSDPLRGRTLQSIQTVISHSLSDSARGANKQQSAAAAPVIIDEEINPEDGQFLLLQPNVWSTPPSALMDCEISNTDAALRNILKKVSQFLKSHSDNVFQDEIQETLKEIIIKAMPFAHILAITNIQERTFHKHFIVILNDGFEKFHGRRIGDIRKEILKTISDILLGEFSFIKLVQESIPETYENAETPLSLNLQPSAAVPTIIDDGTTPQMQNGDLAEADQTRVETTRDDEGAVGGVANGNEETDNVEEEGEQQSEMPNLDFLLKVEADAEYVEQGLDQVPTRLTTTAKSPRERSSSRSADSSEHF